jgi:hypothetical protein
MSIFVSGQEIRRPKFSKPRMLSRCVAEAKRTGGDSIGKRGYFHYRFQGIGHQYSVRIREWGSEILYQIGRESSGSTPRKFRTNRESGLFFLYQIGREF